TCLELPIDPQPQGSDSEISSIPPSTKEHSIDSVSLEKNSGNNPEKIENISDNTSSHEVTASSNSDVSLSLIDIFSHNASSMPADSLCNKILDTEAEEEPCGPEKWSQPKLHDTKTVTNLSRSDNVSSIISELERDNEIDEVDTSQIIEQGLMQELSQNTSDVEINESYIQNLDNSTEGSA
ncbi:1328_t:CDS:2, partial [Diversispora eburnea]